MSLLPLLLELIDQPLDDSFGFGLYPEDVHYPIMRRTPSIHIARWQPFLRSARNHRNRQNKSVNKSSIGKDGFQVSMAVEEFAPNEISVKTVDNTVVVEGKHEEKEDEHGHIYRHFVRKYKLPKDFETTDVVSTLSSDGVLTIKAPPKASASNERVIPIQQTGPANLSVTQNEKDEDKMTE